MQKKFLTFLCSVIFVLPMGNMNMATLYAEDFALEEFIPEIESQDELAEEKTLEAKDSLPEETLQAAERWEDSDFLDDSYGYAEARETIPETCSEISGTCGATVIWKLKDHVLTLSGTGEAVRDYDTGWHEYTDMIEKIYVTEGITSLGDNLFMDCMEANYVLLPSTLKQIGKKSFYTCENIEFVNLPEGLVSIGEYAFRNCSHLNGVVLPESLIELGKGAFYSCTGLETMNIPSGISRLNDEVFSYSSLKNLVIPRTVKSLGKQSLSGALEELIIEDKNLDLTDAFLHVRESMVIRAPMDSLAHQFAEENGCVFIPTDPDEKYVTGLWKNGTKTEIDAYDLLDISVIEKEPTAAEWGIDLVLGYSDGTEKIVYWNGMCESEKIGYRLDATDQQDIPFSAATAGKTYTLNFYMESNPRLHQEYTIKVKSASEVPELKIGESLSAERSLLGRAYVKFIVPENGISRYMLSNDEQKPLHMLEQDQTGKIIGERYYDNQKVIENLNPGYTYYIYTDPSLQNGNYVRSNQVTYTLSDGSMEKKDLRILKQPKSQQLVEEGRTATLTVEADGDGLTYQWYYKNPGAEKFTKSATGTDPTYRILMKPERNGREMYCVVKDQYKNSVRTNTIRLILELGHSISILDQTQEVEVEKAGALATVFVKADGAGLSYQWYYKDKGSSTYKKSATGTEPAYKFTVTEARDGRKVYCRITDKYGNQVSSKEITASIRKQTPLKILKQPVSVEVERIGEKAILQVEAQGEELHYQWYYKDEGASSYTRSTQASSPSYPTTMKESRNRRSVYCEITDKYGNSVKTNEVTLTILEKESQIYIITHPTGGIFLAGSSATLNITADGEGLTYQWYYKDVNKTSFSKSTVGNTRFYTFKMTEERDGRQIYCKVTDKYGKSVKSNVVTVNAYKATELKIVKQPQNMLVDNLGDIVRLNVEAQGDSLTYKWYSKDPGQTKFTTPDKTDQGPAYAMILDKSGNGRLVYCIIRDTYGNEIKTNTVSIILK